MTDYEPRRGWWTKFVVAFCGIAHGAAGQSSFLVHSVCALAVIGLAAWLQVALWEWAALVLSITVVLAAELFNSAIEVLAQAIDRSYNPRIGRALDIASGAVLIAAIGAAMVGAVVFLPHLWELWAGGE